MSPASLRMKKKLAFIIPLLVFATVVPIFFSALFEENKEEIPSPLVGKPLPDFLLPSLLDGQLLSRADIVGEPFLLNVWGSWCPSCIVEHPYLEQLSHSGIRVVGLNYKDKPEAARAFLEQLGNPYHRVIVDETGSYGLDLGVYGAPETYLIDARGFIVLKRVGVLDERVWQQQFALPWAKVKEGR